MGGRDKIRIAVGVVGVVALGVVLALPGAVMASPSPPCGPGPRWVSDCPSGFDKFLSTSRHGIIIIDADDGGGTFPLPDFSGAMSVFRGAGNAAGHIDTEIISLVLSGGGLTLRAGDGTGNLLRDVLPDGRLFSPGAIDGQPIADSFFDVFFEISPTRFGPLHNEAFDVNGNRINECTMQAVIDRVPPVPETVYICDPQDFLPLNPAGIDLFDNAGVHRAILTGDVSHIVGQSIPEPSTLLLLGSGLAGLSAAAWRRTRNR